VQGVGDRLDVFSDVDTDAVLTVDDDADLVTDEVRRASTTGKNYVFRNLKTSKVNFFTYIAFLINTCTHPVVV